MAWKFLVTPRASANVGEFRARDASTTNLSHALARSHAQWGLAPCIHAYVCGTCTRTAERSLDAKACAQVQFKMFQGMIDLVPVFSSRV